MAFCFRTVARVGVGSVSEMSGKQIGVDHSDATESLEAVADTVLAMCPSAQRTKLSEELADLRQWRARIAVIGQVKAGKSTFLSALINAPGFLPSEVNPWTSVVTNLHFAHPDDPQSGGEFHFYDEKTWARIIEGDPEVRQMAEEMLPGFKAETLRRQVEEMRARAQKRLGSYYSVLHGRSHRYEIVNRDTLERYVCAGQEDHAEHHAPVGRYADLTERADIFFPPGPFAAPVVLSDTPGVNDPFMVRDEYTCRSIAQSEIFIVMLSAHQALTDVDAALLRMLSRRSDNEVIICINRADELSDVGPELEAVIADVRARAQEAVPGRCFPIIGASAYWAELALDAENNPEALAQALTDENVTAHLRRSFQAIDANALFAASGVPAVMAAIGEAVDGHVGLNQRRRIGAAIESSAGVCRALLSDKREQISRVLEESADGSASAQYSRDALREKITAISDARDSIQGLIDRGRNDLDACLDDAFRSVRRALELELTGYVEEVVKDFFAVRKARKLGEQYEFDTLALRDLIENRFVDSYAAARDRLDRVAAELRKKVAAATSANNGVALAETAPDALPGEEVTPAFHSSSSRLTLELTSKRGWRIWRSAKLSDKDAKDRLSRIIRAEFHATISSLATQSQDALAARSRAATNDLSSACMATLAATEEQTRELEEKIQSVEADPKAGARLREFRKELKAAISDIDKGREILEEASSRIAALTPGDKLNSARTGTDG